MVLPTAAVAAAAAAVAAVRTPSAASQRACEPSDATKKIFKGENARANNRCRIRFGANRTFQLFKLPSKWQKKLFVACALASQR